MFPWGRSVRVWQRVMVLAASVPFHTLQLPGFPEALGAGSAWGGWEGVPVGRAVPGVVQRSGGFGWCFWVLHYTLSCSGW